MAFGIDTNSLLYQWIPHLESVLSIAAFARDRYQVYKVYACATVVSQDDGVIRHISHNADPFSVTQDALDWQAGQDEHVGEGDVYKHLAYMSSTPTYRDAQQFLSNAISPTFAARRLRPASSYRRQSFRLSTLEVYGDNTCESPGYHVGVTALDKLLEASESQKIPREWWESFIDDDSPGLLWTSLGVRCAVLWQMQVDFLDLDTPSYARPEKRSRGRYGPFLQVTPLSDDKRRFNGVRWRQKRKRFVAETRLRGHPNKVSFGDFKSATEAARAIDAVFYYYRLWDRINFADTLKNMSMHPMPDGLSDDAKLKFVKEKAAKMAFMAPSLAVLGFSGTPSSVSFNETDTGLSQLQSPAWKLSVDNMVGGSIHISSILEPSPAIPGADLDAVKFVENYVINSDTVPYVAGSSEQYCCGIDSESLDSTWIAAFDSSLAPCDVMSQSLSIGVPSPGPFLFDMEKLEGFQDDIGYRFLEQQPTASTM